MTVNRLELFLLSESNAVAVTETETVFDRVHAKGIIQGEIIYPPPPLPHFWPKSIFQGRGGGVYILRPHAAGIL